MPTLPMIPFEELVACVGEKKALLLCQHFAGRKVPSALNVLRARRDSAMVKDWFDGAQLGEISLKYNIPIQTLKKKINRLVKEQISNGCD